MVVARGYVRSFAVNPMRTVSIVLDERRLQYITERITPGAREFSKWIRDAIDLRIEFEKRSDNARLRDEARRIALSQLESQIRATNARESRRKAGGDVVSVEARPHESSDPDVGAAVEK